MSTRVKFLVLLMILFSLMTLLLGYSVKTEELKKTSASLIGIFLVVAAIVSALAIFFILLSWRDPTSRSKFKISYSISWIAIFTGFLGYFFVVFVMGKKKIPYPSSSSLNNTTLSHPSSGGPVLPEHNITSTNSTSTVASSTVYLLYALTIVFIAVAAYFAVAYYREALKKRKRRELYKRARQFDKKLDEIGLDMFSDPREAIVGIYKNAVLWLEYLGIPYKESWTHWEHAERVQVFKEPFKRITELFEKAKYAPEKVTWEDAEKALELYRKMRGALNEAP
ncbi:MAG: DUF4129 domain-containing protein [Thermococcus sp.]|nr:DUF4129 domain-containing protein [Thermococcus sp.]